MALSAVIYWTLFKDKDGGGGAGRATIVKHRFFSFLLWQSIQSTLLLFLSKILLLFPFTQNHFTPVFVSFVSFHLSLLLFSISLFFVSSPHPLTFASPFEVSFSLVRLIFVAGGDQSFLRRVRVSMSFVLFVSLCAVAGALSAVCVCWGCAYDDGGSRLKGIGVLAILGFRGFVLGLFYGMHYVYKQRWVLRFPIIQRPPFFSFKMGLPLAVQRAVKFSAFGFALSGVLALFLPTDRRNQGSMSNIFTEQIVFYIGSFIVILCWELNHHLHQVLHTKRFQFVPSKGSEAAEKNPSEPLLATLEESTPKSLLQYLAYLDLCMVCENNVDTWRRAAFFEDTGETYKRVITACLWPLELLTQNLAECLQSSSIEKLMPLSDHLSSPTEMLSVSKLHEPFFNSQLCVWCARILASLTVRSHKEDKFGVAQMSGSNAAVISTLLSTLLAVETLMGKKMHVQSAHLMDPAGIKWATVNTGRRESTSGTMQKIRGSALYDKAYSLAGVLKTSVYCIVSSFHDEMMNSAKAGLLEKDWINSGKPTYGTHELLVHKLRQFLDLQVN